MKTVLKLKTWF